MYGTFDFVITKKPTGNTHTHTSPPAGTSWTCVCSTLLAQMPMLPLAAPRRSNASSSSWMVLRVRRTSLVYTSWNYACFSNLACCFCSMGLEICGTWTYSLANKLICFKWQIISIPVRYARKVANWYEGNLSFESLPQPSTALIGTPLLFNAMTETKSDVHSLCGLLPIPLHFSYCNYCHHIITFSAL